MRLLLVTYYFPPAGGGGVQRVLGWCRHLGEHGIDVTVAAPEQPQWLDVDPTLVVPPQVRVVHTPDPSPVAVIPTAELAAARSSVQRLARRLRMQPRRLAVPDIHRRWRRPAVETILRAAAEHGAEARGSRAWDVVVSSSPPETTHLIARDVAAELGIPWVADFRDSWLDLPHLRLDSALVRAKHARNVRLATSTMRRATAASTVSEPLAADLRRRHPELDVHVIRNGVELADVQRALPRMDGFRESGRFVITYTGNFFGLQTPRTLLEAVGELGTRDPAFADEVQLRFVGGLKPRDQALIAADPVLSRVVEHTEFLRHDDVLAQQAAADLLFVYVAPGRGSEGVFTGKVFEYVAVARPVLALAPHDNACSELLRRAGSTTVAAGGAQCEPDDVESVVDALVACWTTWRRAGGRDGGRLPDVAVPAAVRAEIDSRRGAAKLAGILHGVVGGTHEADVASV